jgi:hypothetical protein
MDKNNKWLYRYSPPENMLGIIYTSHRERERFSRFVTEDHEIWLGKLTHRYLFKEIPLGPRTAHIFLSNILTADCAYLDLELKVFFRVDPRNAATDNLIQVIKMADKTFESPVRTHTEERVRNEIFARVSAEEALSYNGRRKIRRAISSMVSEKVKGMGISVNDRFGASIMNIQPNAIYQRALQEEAAATSLGNAAYKRLAPTLDNIQLEEELQVLYTHLASTMTKTGEIPSTFYAAKTPANTGQKNIEKEPEEQKKRRDYKYPIAAD